MRGDGRRVVLVDECLGDRLAAGLRRAMRQAVFTTTRDLGAQGALDIALFQTLARNDVDAILTRDFAQLRRPDERAALREAGLVWIGLEPSREGSPKLQTRMAELSSSALSLQTILANWPTAPSAVRIPLRRHPAVGKLPYERL